MMIKRIADATRVLGQSQGYIGLPLRDLHGLEMPATPCTDAAFMRDVEINCKVNGPGTRAMETAWEPTPAEIAAIVSGAPIVLRVLGTAHPPVMLYVGEEPLKWEKES